MVYDPCPICGCDRNLVGVRHNCRVRDDTAHLLRSPANAERLLKSIASADRNITCPNCETLQARVAELDARLASYRSNDRVARYRAKRTKAGLPTLGDYNKFKPALIERDGKKCVYCHVVSNLVVDHMVPIAQGGTDDIDNLALACKACNSGKAGRVPEQCGYTIKTPTAMFALAKYRASMNVTVTSYLTPLQAKHRAKKKA